MNELASTPLQDLLLLAYLTEGTFFAGVIVGIETVQYGMFYYIHMFLCVIAWPIILFLAIMAAKKARR